MRETPELSLGPTARERLSIRPLRRTHPSCTDFWDGNWLATEVTARVSGFQAHVEISLRTTDFEKFRTALRGLSERLSGEAVFETMEQCLTVRLTGNQGHVTARCEVRDAPEVGGRLNFTLNFDQKFVPAMLAQLDAILEAFPVVGNA